MIAVLYALAMTVLTVYGLNLFWLAVVCGRNDRLLPGPFPHPAQTDLPAIPVTIQVPLYNEALVAERIIDACARLRYAKGLLEIQILDDSTDETVELIAERVHLWRSRGVDMHHIRRKDRTDFKAGALQHGLRSARGERIAVFDADFVPAPDFLRQVLPAFDDASVGMAQARWGHLNAEDSLLTRIQAFGLDTHFAVEQYARNRAGCFMNFNGTAGVWRRECIEDAGGWHGDTLAEDLDLSYRAQLKGWQFRLLKNVEAPAELPADINALRNQQFRWTKGAVETARKLLGALWQSTQPWRVKLEGTLHLTTHVVFPFLTLAAVLHAPLLLLEAAGRGPGSVYFAFMGLGMAGFMGFFVAQLMAQRALYPNWGKRLLLFPLFMAGSMGMALSNTRAIWQGLRGKRSAFVRTPKYSAESWWNSRYADRRIPGIMWLEALLALYCMAGLVAISAQGAWAATPFQAVFALAFTLVTIYNVQQIWLPRRRQ